jgi:integrase
MECSRFRVLSSVLDRLNITIHSGKGGKDRVTVLPDSLLEDIKDQYRQVSLLHQRDMVMGYAGASMPEALARKYPVARHELKWQYLFPSARLAVDPRNPGQLRRHHFQDSNMQKAMRRAVQLSGVHERVS